MTGEPRNEDTPIHPCGGLLRRAERVVFLLAVIVVLLDVFLWRP